MIQQKPINSEERGFTLIEMMIVISLISMLTYEFVPMLIDYQMNKYETEAAENHLTEVKMLQEQARQYRFDKGIDPTITLMTANGYLPSGFPKQNEWGFTPTLTSTVTGVVVATQVATKWKDFFVKYLPLSSAGAVVGGNTSITSKMPWNGLEASHAAFLRRDGSDGGMTGALKLNNNDIVNVLNLTANGSVTADSLASNTTITASGDITSNGTVSGTTLASGTGGVRYTADAAVTSGGACSPNGLTKTDANGQLFSCKSGAWVSTSAAGGFQSSMINPVTGQTWNGSIIREVKSFQKIHKAGRRTCVRTPTYITFTVAIRMNGSDFESSIALGNSTTYNWTKGLASYSSNQVYTSYDIIFTTPSSGTVFYHKLAYGITTGTSGAGTNTQCTVGGGPLGWNFSSVKGS